MDEQNLTRRYMWLILVMGFVCLALSLFHFPFNRLDLQFFILFVFTIGLGSRITIQIPRFKSHIAVSDTYIFLALLLYGGETAIILAAVEAFCSSWRFCNKKFTVFFNTAAMALSTTLVVSALKLLGVLYADSGHYVKSENLDDFIIALSAMIFVQFIANTTIASIYGALKSEKPLWETWKTKYLWISITYIVGAISAGVLLLLTHYAGFGVVVVSFPIIYFVYLSYRMNVRNVEMSIAQAEQAKGYADTLEKQSIALRESEGRFRSAFNYAPIGIALVSPAGSWLKVNHALSQILGYTEEEFLAADFQSMIHPEDLGNMLVKIHELYSGKIPTYQIEQRYLHKSGRIVWSALSASMTSDAKVAQPNLIFQIQDITDKKQAEEKLQYDATHDALTGLPNRACFMKKLEQALEKQQADASYKVSVIFIDLDRFKVINDSLGHSIGDELLIGIAERLKDCLRPSDMVARLGGDEFTILVGGRHTTTELVLIAERIKKKFAVPFDLCGHEIYSSASMGILHSTENHVKPEDLLRDADTAMYQAKRSGRACHEIFNPNMHEAVKETLQLETDLRRAVEKQSFEVYYQPIYSLVTGKVEGFEALARWEHETLGTISPAKFIPLAEEIGLVDQIDKQVMERACREIGSLNRSAPDEADFYLCINLSCKQFAQPNMVKKIRQILEKTEFPPRLLKIEITETVFLEHKQTAIEMLNELRALGIEINVDDFGTGYSNLSYLMQLPISTLKIDRSFVSPLETNERNLQIVQTIVMLARSLGMKVIAEGVETVSQMEFLKNLNCEGAQGFLFAEPMIFEDVRAFLVEKQVMNIPPEFDNMPVVSAIQ